MVTGVLTGDGMKKLQEGRILVGDSEPLPQSIDKWTLLQASIYQSRQPLTWKRGCWVLMAQGSGRSGSWWDRKRRQPSWMLQVGQALLKHCRFRK